ncbi:hypothetical protein ES702_00191 [subsurface metagenome]
MCLSCNAWRMLLHCIPGSDVDVNQDKVGHC